MPSLGTFERATRSMHVSQEDLPPAARGRKGLAREVVREGNPYVDSTVRGWVETLERDDPEGRAD